MTTTSDFYTQQAIRDEQDAAKATLDNVRERCLRSAKVWRLMAERVARAQTMRATIDGEKAAARQAQRELDPLIPGE